MSFSDYIVPVLALLLVVYARFKGVKVYDAFTDGVKKAPPLALSLFPYLAAIFIMTELFDKSGLADLLAKLLAPVWEFLGVPTEISDLILIKPFSGSGSLAVLSSVYEKHGADSYIARCASVIFGSSETVFYVSAVYFAGCRNKKLLTPIIISLCCSLISAVLACLICKIT